MDPNPNSNSPPNSEALSRTTHLTRRELLRRRFRNLNLLSQNYRDLYWALIHHLYTLYTTQYPFSPFDDDSVPPPKRCAFHGCHSNAMALTSFCHLHILSDPRQMLYIPCTYVLQSAEDGPITCMKPVTRSTVPALCRVHFEEAQMHLTRTLRTMTGLNISSTPKFHVIVTQFVRHIQAKRLKARNEEETTPTVLDDNEVDANNN